MNGSALWRVALATIIAIIPMGMTGPLIAVEMDRQGLDASAIGVYAALPFAAVLAMTWVVPRILHRIGTLRGFQLAIAVSALATVWATITRDYSAWCLAALINGAAGALLWVAAEAVIAAHAPPERLGRITGLYQTALAAALAVGPLIPVVMGWTLGTAAPIAWACAVAAVVPVLGLSGVAREAGAPPRSLLRMVAVVPALAVLAATGGVFEAGLSTLGTVQALDAGAAETTAPAVAAAIALGSFAVQYPLGWAADRLPARQLARGSLVALILSALALPAALDWFALMLALAALWGAVGGGLYTLTMIRVGRETRDLGIASVAAAVIACYTTGSVVGPLIAGWAIDLAPRHGLALVLGTLATLALATVLWLERRVG